MSHHINRLKIPAVDVSTKYPVILQSFQKELQQVQSEYNNKKSSPPIARNIPPVAGRIAWSRQLYQKITKPIKGFQTLPALIGQSECRRVIKSYNRLAQVLVEYELLHIQLWTQKLPSIRNALTSTVLIRNKGQLFVNFDPQINEFLREVQILNTMDIDVPGDMTSLYLRKKSILANYDSVQVKHVHTCTLYMYMYSVLMCMYICLYIVFLVSSNVLLLYMYMYCTWYY